jgi:hypothetical protein
MTFQKEKRYRVYRVHETTGRELFLADAKGSITQHTGQFGVPWTNGEPARFTLHQATKLKDALNAQLPEVAELVKTDYLPTNRLWQTQAYVR